MRGAWLGLGFAKVEPGGVGKLSGRTFDGPFALVLDASDTSVVTVESMTVGEAPVQLMPPKPLPWTNRGYTTWHGTADRAGAVDVIVRNTGKELVYVAGGLVS